MYSEMESNTQTAEAVPFFARFLENQKSEQLEQMDANGPTTLKYPSDWEDH